MVQHRVSGCLCHHRGINAHSPAYPATAQHAVAIILWVIEHTRLTGGDAFFGFVQLNVPACPNPQSGRHRWSGHGRGCADRLTRLPR
jgi:hypothetical protein